MKIVFSILLFLEILYYVSMHALGTCLIWYLIALSKTMNVGVFVVRLLFTHCFWTFRSTVSREMPLYFMVILSTPYRKLHYLKKMITKCETKRIKSKVILHKKLTCTVISQFLLGQTFQRIEWKPILFCRINFPRDVLPTMRSTTP